MLDNELPNKAYSIIYADPPWSYKNRGTRAAASKHYDTMTLAGGVSAMRTIQIAYIPSDEQWERLTAIHKKMRKAGMFDGHSEDEMLRFKMDADQSHYIDCVLTALEQDYYRYFGDGSSSIRS